ncbi:DUF3606 domain-containing protein [Roseomonas nepalensis]|uniref:DUF3606 domain-containing protein n=1 Tax=Muricoccus nepalensis TaxID=1854500 RepID=A0A502FQU6_9PROT|nr:DUF3606 domain-containing protein [Roseomonas nepalensis]TPG51794.1 DUF3606 domain-containing protein [Roseomonas nepalensis]
MADRKRSRWLVRDVIDIDDDANARFWTGVFQVSELDLATAVMLVGADAKEVAKFLGDAARTYKGDHLYGS